MTVAENLALIAAKLKALLLSLGREQDSVRLIAVSKKQSVEKIKATYDAGQRDFGENYLQEALDKLGALPDDICWHFIGAIQSNKTRLIAENFSWVHTLAREKIAERLNAERPKALGQLNVCVQVNIDREVSKSGLLPEEVANFLSAFPKYKNLKLRGLMFIPQQRDDYKQQLAVFQQAEKLFLDLKLEYPGLDTLSMGMSQDYQAAIAAGSTMIRIGTAIFGSRDKES